VQTVVDLQGTLGESKCLDKLMIFIVYPQAHFCSVSERVKNSLISGLAVANRFKSWMQPRMAVFAMCIDNYVALIARQP
jgi:hypothetical protein